MAKLTAAGGLAWGTYLGGNGDDDCTAIALDPSRNVYVAGSTTSSNFPAAPYQNGGAFSAKIAADGSRVVYSLVYGPAFSKAFGIAADSGGNAYVVGRTPTHWLTTSGSFEPNYGGGNYDAFAMKVNPAGNALVYSTYLGGKGEDGAYAVSVDSAGNAYVAGETSSTDFPTASAIQESLGGGYDVFVTKLNPTGSALVYSTYLGGSGGDSAYAMALDSSGAAYVTGVTTSLDFPTAHPFQSRPAGGDEVFIAKIDPSGSGGGATCTYSLSPESYSPPASGGSIAVDVAAPAGCSWSVANSLTWATNSATSGTGNGTVTVQVAANTGVARSGAMTIAGNTFSVSQAAPSSAPFTGTVLISGVPTSITLPSVTATTLFHGDFSYRIDVPQNATQLTIEILSTQSITFNLYARFGSDVALSGGTVVSDVSTTGSGARKVITITPASNPALRAGSYYLGILLTTTGVAVQGAIQATFTQDSALSPGTAVNWNVQGADGPTLYNGTYGYRISVAKSVTRLEIVMTTATTGTPVDIYIRYGSDVAVANGSVLADYFVKGSAATKRIVIDGRSSPPLRSGVYYIAFVVNAANIWAGGTLVGNTTTGPAVSDDGIVGSASYSAAGIVPGSPFSIFGSGFAAAEAQAASVPLPTLLGNVQVKVNGIAVPLFYVSPTQINAQLPYEIQPGQAQATILVNGVSSGALTIQVNTTGPGIIYYPLGADLRAVCVNQDGSINGPSAAAPRGSAVTVYLIGGGPVKPGQPLVTGAGSPMELRWLDSTYSVTLGGVAAAVDYIGLTPGSVGLYQLMTTG